MNALYVRFASCRRTASSLLLAVRLTILRVLEQAGAAHVYAVEMSGIAEQARQIVADNGYSERITLLQAKVEDITLPVAQVRLALYWPLQGAGNLRACTDGAIHALHIRECS